MENNPFVYHVAPAERWRSWPPHAPYQPAEYATDGFVHCTGSESLTLAVANRYYRNVPDSFVLLTLEVARLDAPLRWEESGDDLAPLFPHLYGLINPEAVVAVCEAVRAPDGTFQRWAD